MCRCCMKLELSSYATNSGRGDVAQHPVLRVLSTPLESVTREQVPPGDGGSLVSSSKWQFRGRNESFWGEEGHVLGPSNRLINSIPEIAASGSACVRCRRSGCWRDVLHCAQDELV